MPQIDLAKTGPPFTSRVLRRTRLFKLLDDNRNKRLIVVQAQKGQGKSVLVSDYLAAREYDYAWYTLDESDAHLLNLLNGLSHSVSRTRHFCFYPPQPSGALSLRRSPEALVREWIERNLDSLEEDFFLVLDDSQRGSPATETLLGTLLSSSRTNIRAVVISRWPLRDDMTRFCRQGECLILGNEDLKFTWTEARELFEGVSGGTFSEKVVREVWERSEGWVAGLLLFKQLVREGSPPGDDRNLLAFLRKKSAGMFQDLAREVLETFSASELEFLMAASLFENVRLPLPEEITGQVDAMRLLELMRVQNLFTSRSQSGDGSYIFHSLFKSFLRSQARIRLGRERKRVLTLTVADHLASRLQLPEAVDVLLRGKLFTEAAKLVEENGLSLCTSAWPGLARHWAASFPRALVEENPWLRLLISREMVSDSPAEASEGLEVALGQFTRRGDHAGRSICLAHLAEMSMFLPGDSGPLTRIMETINGLIGTPGLGDYPCRCLLLFTAGLHELYRGANLDRGARALAAAAAISRKHNDVEQAMLCLFYALILTLHKGELDEAEEVLAKADGLLGIDPDSKVLSSLRRIMQTGSDLFGGRFQKALNECAVTREGLREAGLMTITPILNAWELLLRLTLGDGAGTRALMEKLGGDPCRQRNTLHRAGHLMFGAMLEGFHGKDLQGALSDVDQAVRLLEREGEGFVLWVARFVKSVMEARAGSPGKAQKELKALRGACRKNSASQLLTSIEACMALLDFRLGHEASGARLLGQAFGRAAARGYLFFFCLPHDDLALLCEQAVTRGITTTHAWRIIDSLPPEAAARTLSRLAATGAPDVGRQVLRALSSTARLAPAARVPVLRILCEAGMGDVSGEAKSTMSDLLAADPPLSFTILDGFRVSAWGSGVNHETWRSAKALALLKLLCVHFPQSLTREAAAEALWPEGKPASMLLNLRVTLSRLRKLLAEIAGNVCLPVIKSSNTSIGLNPLLCRVDLLEFRRLHAEAMRSWAGGDRERFLEQAGRALGLCSVDRGDDDLDCEWVMQAREDTAHRYHELLWNVSLAEESKGNLPVAVQFLERIVAADNLREDAYRGIMRLHADMGNRAEAIRTYRSCRDALRREIGVEPDKDTRELLRSSLGVDPLKV